jgi:hypothetical protein
VAEEAVDVAERLGDREMVLVCRLFGQACSLERGDIAAFERGLSTFVRLAEDSRHPQALWYAALMAATRAMHLGLFEQGERLAARFYELGRRIGDANAYHSVMTHRLVAASWRGCWAQVANIADEACARYPVFIGWRAARTWALAKGGEDREARREVSFFKRVGLSNLPLKMDWPVSMAFLAEASMLLGDRELAASLYERMLPLEGRLVVLGLCVMSWGSVSRYLGLLAQTLGRREEAARWYEDAIASNTRAKALPWLAHCEVEYARLMAEEGSAREQRVAQDLRLRAESRARDLGIVIT